MKRIKFVSQVLILFLPLVFMLSVFLTNFSTPFRTIDEDDGYLFAGIARAHIFLGLGKTYGQDFFYNGLNKEPVPYLHHPPGVGLSLALILKLLNFGNLDEAFWQERLLPTVYHSGSYFLMILMAFSVFKSFKATLLAGSLFVLVPMSLYYGRLVSHEPPTLFFLLLSSLLYLIYEKGKETRVFCLMLVSIFFTCLYGWPGFYFIPAMLFIDFVDIKKRRINLNQKFWILVGFELILLGLFFGQILVANGFQFKPIFELMSAKNTIPYTLADWLKKVAGNFLNYYTPLLAIPAGLYILYLFKKLIKKTLVTWEKVVMMLTLVDLTHIILWRIGSFDLPYWQIYFLPAVILTATYLVLKIEKYLRPLKFRIAYYLLIFYIIVAESQPLVYDLYTKSGRYPFPHFFINGL